MNAKTRQDLKPALSLMDLFCCRPNNIVWTMRRQNQAVSLLVLLQAVLFTFVSNVCDGWSPLLFDVKSQALKTTMRSRDDSRRKRRRTAWSTWTLLLSSSSSSLSLQRHEYDQQEEHIFVATCIPGLSQILSEELIELGAQSVETTGKAACRFQANLETVLQILIWARTPHKIMELLCESPPTLRNRQDLYQFVQDTIPVKQLLGDGKGGLLSLSVASTILNNPPFLPKDINHSHFTALTIKNALCDAVRDLRGDRPNVDTIDPDLPLTVVLRGIKPPTPAGQRGSDRSTNRYFQNRHQQQEQQQQQPRFDSTTASTMDATAQLSLFRQIHNGSLHRRGYRTTSAIHKAAMKESLAAGLLISSGWPQQCRQFRAKVMAEQQAQEEEHGGENRPTMASSTPLVLMDPMAGSGSLLLEGLFVAADVAPQVLRLKCGLEPRTSHQYPPITRWKHPGYESSTIVSLWKELLLKASSRAKEGLQLLRTTTTTRKTDGTTTPLFVFLANDVHAGSLALLEQSLNQAGVADLVQVSQFDCRDYCPSLPLSSSSWTVVCNPPWSVRLTTDVKDSWESLRFFLRNTCPDGTVAHVLSGNAEATKHLGLRRSASIPIQVGQVHMRWLTYPIITTNNQNNTTTTTTTTTRTTTTHNNGDMVNAPQSNRVRRATTSVPPPKKPRAAAVTRGMKPMEKNEWRID